MLKTCIQELIAAGATEKEIAQRAGCTQPTINRLKCGKQTDTQSRIADAIRAFHRERCDVAAA